MSKEIPLTKGYVAIVDDEDYPVLSRYKWQVSLRNTSIYASTDINRKKIYMHRLIMGEPKGMTVDHRDGDGLNNRRSNLRIATRRQNVINRLRMLPDTASKYRGVFLSCNKRAWRAQIRVKGKSIGLGTYRTQADAALAYNEAALKYHDGFAVLNEIAPQPDPDDPPFPAPKTPEHAYVGIKKSRGRWAARVGVGKLDVWIGTFDTVIEAAQARDKYVIENGLNHRLNFPAS